MLLLLKIEHVHINFMLAKLLIKDLAHKFFHMIVVTKDVVD